ncbi:MAG: zinc ribbon domain-containing protein [Myxococcota bacterium]|nr:zinc ribbon domain-containing protein [Myxococcota bacterium]
MPIYEYGPDSGDGCEYCANGFEILQKISAKRLSHCPACSGPVRRLLSAPSVKMGRGSVLSAKNIEKHGFTQYKNTGQGFERTAGTKGPKTITP